MRLLLLLCLWVSLTLPGWAAPLPAADRPESWLPLLAGKRLGVVVNPSSRVGTTHLVDFLRRQNLKLQTIFAPEHGFRGMADAGAHLDDGLDAAT
ncbi:MAG: exo-beta-N-acetylmuramidase NamZ domain-containing protein, partial [Candidatus Sericytochromatia bacterium]